MEPKKTNRADLTRKTFLFFNVGLIVALTLVIFAFSFKTAENTPTVEKFENPTLDPVIDVPSTVLTPPKPPKLVNPVEVDNKTKEIVEQSDPLVFEFDGTEAIPEIVIDSIAEPVEIDNRPHVVVEESAAPIGGMNEFMKFISQRIKYPTQAKRMGIDGRVYVEFIVERDGSLSNVQVVKGIGGGCDEEAVRVVSSSPTWKPGKQRGKPVRQKMVLPVYFVLQ